MTDLALRPASELVRLLHSGQVSCRELLDHYLERIDALNPGINAVVTLDFERARMQAEAADAARAKGEVRGPLHGLPMTIKDTFEVEGMRTTAGAPELSHHVPAASAVAAQRLLDAGAILFGKTNVPLYAGDVQSYNTIFGTTNNPWNAAHTPGGSSGGAAAALAAGLTAAEFGSDIGGSIRTPASWCGIYGHKPSWGIIPMRGHIPGPPGALAEIDLAVVGPMARSADDLELLLGVTAGPAPDRARAWTLRLPPARRERLQDYRVAFSLDHPGAPIDAEVIRVIGGAVDALRRAGVRLEERAPEGVDLLEAARVYYQLLYPIILSGYPQETIDQMRQLAATLPQEDDSARARAARYGTEMHRDWLFANEARQQYRAQLARFFDEVDVFLCPVTPVAAIPHDQSDPMPERTIRVNGQARPYFELFNWISIASMAHLPASVAPVGRTAAGLPIGVQIVGPHLEDLTPIDFARRLGDVVGGFEPPPGI